jgi:arylsulfatase A-like enzyme
MRAQRVRRAVRSFLRGFRGRAPLAAAALGAGLASLGLGCARESGPPNLLLVSLDTTRRDHTSVYGYERATTPNLEKLAAEGVRFAMAYAPSSTTGPTHATLFTSLHPITHRVVKNGRVLTPPHETLAERLRAHGWVTAGVVSSYVLDARFGYAQGFDVWDDDFDPATATVRGEIWEGAPVEVFDRRADATTARAVAWLDGRSEGTAGPPRDASRPFFLFAHYFDPHAPWVPPADVARAFPPADGPGRGLPALRARYDAEIAFADRQLGVLLDALAERGLAENTIVAVTADHGEGLMQHGLLMHGAQIYEEQVRVPLLLRWPARLPAGRVIEGAVSLIDLAPTLLELAGVKLPEDGALHGRSLVPVLEGRASLDPDAPIFLFRQHYERGFDSGVPVAGEQYGVRLGDWKLILGPEEGTRQLFDIARDPRERRDLAAEQPERAAELERRIADWRARYTRDETAPEAVSPEDVERLRALGYVQ